MPTVTVAPPEIKFTPNDPKALAYLQQHGFCVFGSVLSAAQCREARGLVWDFVENMGTGVTRTDISTWTDDKWTRGLPETGIVAFDGIGQSEAQWLIRGSPAVQDAFSGIWGSAELLTSFDGVCR